jgi:hypothetical protein
MDSALELRVGSAFCLVASRSLARSTNETVDKKVTGTGTNSTPREALESAAVQVVLF